MLGRPVALSNITRTGAGANASAAQQYHQATQILDGIGSPDARLLDPART